MKDTDSKGQGYIESEGQSPRESEGQRARESEGQRPRESEGQKPRKSEGLRHIILFPDKIMVTKPMTSDPKGKLEFEKIIEVIK